MREILFRGKQEYDGKWVYGGIAKNEDGTVYILGDVCYWDGMEELWKDGHIVIPETIEQYTGLTDKNGTKIFEDDIVRLYLVDDIEMGIIKFNDIMCRFMFFTKDGSYSFDNTCTFEVIGNIHDNPELMKGDNQ